MKRLVLAAVCVSLLGGCATMRPKIDKALHRSHKMAVKAAPVPLPTPAPVVVQAPTPAPAPEKPKSFFHGIKWLH